MSPHAYRTLALIELRHAFFADGRGPALQWQPLPLTQRWLERQQALLRPTERGLLLLAPAAAQPEAQDLHFLVQAGDPLFANYTAERCQDPASLLLFDAADEEDLRPESLLRGAPRTEPFAAGLRGRPPAFALRLAWREPGAEPGFEPRRHRCLLTARATRWKYCLVGDWLEDAGEQQLQILDLEQNAQFEPAAATALPDGRAALSFLSTAPIALQQRPALRLQLRRRGGGTERVLVKRLPLASAGHLSREVLGGEPTLVSEIYVHR